MFIGFCVPQVDYEVNICTGKLETLDRCGKVHFMSNLSMLLQWSPYSTEVELLQQVIEQVEVEYVPEKAEFDGHFDKEFRKDSLDSLVFTYTQKMGRSAYYNPCIWGFIFIFFYVL
ncbi:hypothetical protein ACSBR1_033695 [Camellia fascicularis]